MNIYVCIIRMYVMNVEYYLLYDKNNNNNKTENGTAEKLMDG